MSGACALAKDTRRASVWREAAPRPPALSDNTSMSHDAECRSGRRVSPTRTPHARPSPSSGTGPQSDLKLGSPAVAPIQSCNWILSFDKQRYSDLIGERFPLRYCSLLLSLPLKGPRSFVCSRFICIERELVSYRM